MGAIARRHKHFKDGDVPSMLAYVNTNLVLTCRFGNKEHNHVLYVKLRL